MQYVYSAQPQLKLPSIMNSGLMKRLRQRFADPPDPHIKRQAVDRMPTKRRPGCFEVTWKTRHLVHLSRFHFDNPQIRTRPPSGCRRTSSPARRGHGACRRVPAPLSCKRLGKSVRSGFSLSLFFEIRQDVEASCSLERIPGDSHASAAISRTEK